MLRWKVVRCRSHDANDHEIFRVVMVPKIPKANDEGLYSFTGILMLSCGNGCQNPSRTTASPNTAGIPRLRMESLVEKHFHAQEIHEMFVVTEDVVYNNEFRVFPFMYINVAMIAKSDILGGDDVVASFALPNMFESPGSQNKFERSRWYLFNNYLLLLSFRLAVNHCLADSCNANGTFHATCQTPPFLLNVTTQFFEEYGEANCCKWTTSTATVGKLMNERTVFGLAITQRVLEIKSVKVGAWFERVLGNDALWSALTHRTPYYGDMLRGRGMSYRLINKLCIGTIKFFSDGTMIVSMEMKEQMMQRNPLCQDQIMPFMKAPHPIEETKAIIFSMVAGGDITDILIPNHFITREGVLMVICLVCFVVVVVAAVVVLIPVAVVVVMARPVVVTDCRYKEKHKQKMRIRVVTVKRNREHLLGINIKWSTISHTRERMIDISQTAFVNLFDPVLY